MKWNLQQLSSESETAVWKARVWIPEGHWESSFLMGKCEQSTHPTTRHHAVPRLKMNLALLILPPHTLSYHDDRHGDICIFLYFKIYRRKFVWYIFLILCIINEINIKVNFHLLLICLVWSRSTLAIRVVRIYFFFPLFIPPH